MSESAKILQSATRSWSTVKRLADVAAECLPEKEGRALKAGVKRKARAALLVVERHENRATVPPSDRRTRGEVIVLPVEDEPTEPLDSVEITHNGYEAIQELGRTLHDIEEPTGSMTIPAHRRRRTGGDGE
jgi:hypothetical protein